MLTAMQTFGRLTVLATFRMNRKTFARCQCECGKIKNIRTSSLRRGYTRSCGCIAKERIKLANFKHGQCKRSRMAVGTPPEYATWRSMIQRCGYAKHKSYKHYGARGIKVCDRWKIFRNFFEDMGTRPPGLQLDRINNDGNYEPGNCRWTTPKVNSNNRRPRRR